MLRTDINKNDVCIDQNWRRGRTLPIKIKNFSTKIVGVSCEKEILVIDKTTVVMELHLYSKVWHGIEMYEVESADVNTEYQGNGIGFELYKTLVTKHNLVLFSNGSHSIGSRKNWLRLAKDPKIVAYGFDHTADRVWNLKINSSKELASAKNSPQLYGRRNSSIMLVKKGGHTDTKMKTMMSNSKNGKQVKLDILGTKEYEDMMY